MEAVSSSSHPQSLQRAVVLVLGREQEGQTAAGLGLVGDPAVPVPAGDLAVLDLAVGPARLEGKTVVGPVHPRLEEGTNHLEEVQTVGGPVLRLEGSTGLRPVQAMFQERFPDARQGAR